MIERPKQPTLNEQIGVSLEVLEAQMPYLGPGFNGSVAIQNMPDGTRLIAAFEDKSARVANYIYRLNPQTQMAQLVYFNSKRNVYNKSRDSLVDHIKLNQYLSMEEGFSTLVPLMGVDSNAVKMRFPETQGCDQILINKSPDEKSPKFGITFSSTKEKPPIKFIYDYYLDSDKNKLVYTSQDKWLK